MVEKTVFKHEITYFSGGKLVKRQIVLPNFGDAYTPMVAKEVVRLQEEGVPEASANALLITALFDSDVITQSVHDSLQRVPLERFNELMAAWQKDAGVGAGESSSSEG